jgi:hypothetical protein
MTAAGEALLQLARTLESQGAVLEVKLPFWDMHMQYGRCSIAIELITD